MSWQDDIMIEQERADALEYMGDAEWRDTFEGRHDWAPDYNYEVRKTNVDDISYMYANPDVTKAFKELDERARLTCEWEITTETEDNGEQ